jgi:hypothetical protein
MRYSPGDNPVGITLDTTPPNRADNSMPLTNGWTPEKLAQFAEREEGRRILPRPMTVALRLRSSSSGCRIPVRSPQRVRANTYSLKIPRYSLHRTKRRLVLRARRGRDRRNARHSSREIPDSLRMPSSPFSSTQFKLLGGVPLVRLMRKRVH